LDVHKRPLAASTGKVGPGFADGVKMVLEAKILTGAKPVYCKQKDEQVIDRALTHVKPLINDLSQQTNLGKIVVQRAEQGTVCTRKRRKRAPGANATMPPWWIRLPSEVKSHHNQSQTDLSQLVLKATSLLTHHLSTNGRLTALVSKLRPTSGVVRLC